MRMSKKIKEIILHNSLKDPNFARDILTQLPKHLFSSESEKMGYIYTAIKRLTYTVDNYSTDTVAIKVEGLMNTNQESEEDVTNALKYLDDLYTVKVDNKDESLKTEINKYIKKELSKEALVKFISENKQEDSDNFTELIEQLKQIEVNNLGEGDGEFLDFFNDVEKKKELLSKLSVNKYSTGYTSLDAQIEGGIARGEVGLVIAPSGRGKSLMASNLARNYVVNGLNVLYIGLEEKLDRMVLRTEQQILGVDKSALLKDKLQLNEQVFDALQTKYKEYPTLGNLYMSKHMPGEVSPTKLEQIIINTMIRKDIQIDVVIIDYPKLMRNPYEKYASESESGGRLFEDIRRLSQQYNFVCWTLAQTNRSAYGSDVITSEHVEGSRKIINAVEVALVLNQKDIEFKNGFLRLYLDKVRNSSNTGERFVHMKVNPMKMRIKDETEEEYKEHLALLSDDGREDTNKFQKKENKVDQLNNSFGGLEI